MSCSIAVRAFIVENFLFGNENGLLDTDLLRDKGIIDSTGILELIGFIETNFNLKIEDLEIIPENLDSIKRISSFIEAKQQGMPVQQLKFDIC